MALHLKSTGIDFVDFGDSTEDNELLDDFEEGSFVFVYAPGGGTITVNTSYDYGTYTKIGRFVHCHGHSILNQVQSSTGALAMNGCPFTIADVSEYGGYAPSNSTYMSGLTGGWTGPGGGICIENSTQFLMREWDGSTIATSGAEHMYPSATIGMSFDFHTAT